MDYNLVFLVFSYSMQPRGLITGRGVTNGQKFAARKYPI